MVIRAGACALALFAIGCVEIIGLEVGQRREDAATAASGGGQGGANTGGADAGGSCGEGGGESSIHTFCAALCLCLDGGDPCRFACISEASICITEANQAVAGCMAGSCCSNRCDDISCVMAASCWQPPRAYPTGCGGN